MKLIIVCEGCKKELIVSHFDWFQDMIIFKVPPCRNIDCGNHSRCEEKATYDAKRKECEKLESRLERVAAAAAGRDEDDNTSN